MRHGKQVHGAKYTGHSLSSFSRAIRASLADRFGDADTIIAHHDLDFMTSCDCAPTHVACGVPCVPVAVYGKTKVCTECGAKEPA